MGGLFETKAVIPLLTLGVVGAVIGAVVGTCNPALAQSGAALTLDWQAPAGCPQAEIVTARATQLLGADAVNEAIEVGARVTQPTADHAGWSVSLRLSQAGVDSQRVLSAASCDELADAVALVISMAIREPEIVPSPPHPDRPPIPISSAEEDPPAVRAWARLVMDLGSFDAANLGAAIGATVRTGAWFGQLEASYWPPVSISAPASADKGAALSLVAGAARLCVLPELDATGVRIGPCAALEIGRLAGEGRNISNPRASSSLWIATLWGGQLLWELDAAVMLRLDLALLLNLAPAEVTVAPYGIIHEPSSIAFRGGLGVEIGFP